MKLKIGLNVTKAVKPTKSSMTNRLILLLSAEKSDSEEDKPRTGISHNGVKNAFDLTLQYIEQNPTSTSKDIW